MPPLDFISSGRSVRKRLPLEKFVDYTHCCESSISFAVFSRLVPCICCKAGLNRQCGQPVLLPEFQGAACSTSARVPMPPAGGSPDRNPTSLSHHASEPPNHQAGIGQHIPHNLVSCSNSDICQEVVNPRG